MIASGKTFCSIGIAKLLQNSSIKLLFCCNLLAVKQQVANLCFNAGINFAISYINNGKVKIVKHFSCKSEDKIIVNICSPDAAIQLLNDSEYILFLDEPTIGADTNNKILKNNIEVIKRCPKRTILSSATLPPLNKLSIFYEKWNKYPNFYVKELFSKEIHIGCDVKTFSGHYYLPHMCATNEQMLKMILTKIDNNMFLSRMYSHNSLQLMMNKMEFKMIDFDFKSFDINKIIAANKLLLNSADINKICKIDDKSSEKIDFKLMGTYAAHKYLNLNLIVCDNPYDFVLINFENLLVDLKNNKIKSAKNIFGKYNKHVGFLAIRDVDQTQTAEIDFPNWGQINTYEHIRRYGNINNVIAKFIREINILETTPYDLLKHNDDDIILLLLCGVGIYSSTDRRLNNFYKKYVLNLASEGKLAFLVSDSSICYGVNYPINRVFVTKEIGEQISINTLFQLMGRAGRVGISWKAEIYIDDSIVDKLNNYIKKTDDDIELINMIAMYKSSVEEDRIANIKLQDCIKQQISRLCEFEIIKRKEYENEELLYWKQIKKQINEIKDQMSYKSIASLSNETVTMSWRKR
jgi:hypothetical protein